MSQIGLVTKQSDGTFKGHLRTLTINVEIRFVPIAKPVENGPKYRILAGPVEVGAAWERIGKESGQPYLSVTLATPEFGPKKIYANLGQAAGQDDPDVFAIIWNPAD